MVQLSKVASLLIKTFTKPAVNHAKGVLKKRQGSQGELLYRALYWVGNTNYYFNIKLIRILNSANTENIKTLSYENGVIDGIELLGEIVVYTIILGLGLYEINKSHDSSRREQLRQEQLFDQILSRTQKLEDLSDEIHALLKNLKPADPK